MTILLTDKTGNSYIINCPSLLKFESIYGNNPYFQKFSFSVFDSRANEFLVSDSLSKEDVERIKAEIKGRIKSDGAEHAFFSWGLEE